MQGSRHRAGRGCRRREGAAGEMQAAGSRVAFLQVEQDAQEPVRIEVGKVTEENREVILQRLSQNQDCMRKEILRLEALKEEVMSAGGLVPDSGLQLGLTGEGGCLWGQEGNGLFQSLYQIQDGVNLVPASRMYLEPAWAVHAKQGDQDGLVGNGEHADDFQGHVLYVQEPSNCDNHKQPLAFMKQPCTVSSRGGRMVRKRKSESHCPGGDSNGQVTNVALNEGKTEDSSENVVSQLKDLILKHSEESVSNDRARASGPYNQSCWSRRLLVIQKLRDSFQRLDNNTRVLILSALKALGEEWMPEAPRDVIQSRCSSDSSYLAESRDAPPTLCYSHVVPIQQQSHVAQRSTRSSRSQRKYVASTHAQQASLNMSATSANGHDDDAQNGRTVQPCLVRII